MAQRATTGTPERLLRADGAWKLELERLVYDGPWLLHPRTLEVHGEEAILQQLKDLKGCEPLAKDAQRLFTGTAATVGSYVARENRWIVEINPKLAPPPARQVDAVASSEQVELLNKRIAALEGSIRGLQKLVEEALKLASKAAAGQQTASRTAIEQAAVASDSTLNANVNVANAAPPRSEQSPGAAEPVQAQAAAEPAAPAAARPDKAAAPVAPAAARPDKATAGGSIGALLLPSQTALTDLVRSLAGPNAELIVTSTPVDWATSAGAHGSSIQTKDGREVGLLIFDLEGALRLAGALLMESDEAVMALIETGSMNADMLDAASEVANTFMSAFNKTSGNPHVRAEKLLELDSTLLERIAQGGKREDYHYNRGGNVALIAL